MASDLGTKPTGSKLPVLSTVRNSYRNLATNLVPSTRRFWRLPTMLWCACIVIWGAGPAQHQEWWWYGAICASAFLAMHVLDLAVFRWHRFFLIDHAAIASGAEGSSIEQDDKSWRRFNGSSPGVALLLLMLGLFLLSNSLLALRHFLPHALDPEIVPFTYAGLVAVIIAAALPVYARMLPVLAALSVTVSPFRWFQWREAWTMTKGNTARLSAIYSLALAPFGLAFALVTYIYAPWLKGGFAQSANIGPLIILCSSWVLIVHFGIAILAGCNAQAFVALTGWSPENPEGAATDNADVVPSQTGGSAG